MKGHCTNTKKSSVQKHSTAQRATLTDTSNVFLWVGGGGGVASMKLACAFHVKLLCVAGAKSYRMLIAVGDMRQALAACQTGDIRTCCNMGQWRWRKTNELTIDSDNRLTCPNYKLGFALL